MKRAQYITRCLATSVAALALSLPFFAQSAEHSAPAKAPSSYHPAQNAAPRAPSAPRQPQGQAHVGDWLRRYKNLPPAEQERALENDAYFRSLPRGQQQQLRQQLRIFSSLPPQEQQHVLQLLRRGAVYSGLTQEQRQRALVIHSQMLQLPPDRRLMVRNEIRELRALPPDQRDQVIDSDRVRATFTPHERDILREVVRLPLAPAQNNPAPNNAAPEPPE